MNSFRKPLSALFSALTFATVAALGSTGCQTDAFCWDNCPGDTPSSGSGIATGGAGGTGGTGAAGGAGGEGGDCPITGCIPGSSSGGGCVVTNGGIEICDNLDNDCNNKVDDGPDISFSSPKTCGTCDNNCYTKLLNADPTGIGCDWNMVPGNAGTCTCSKGCAEGWYDLSSPKDCICEYYCVKSANDDSVCNNKDDDCDNQIDEDVNLCTSTTDCGACGNNCVVLNGTPTCSTTGMAGDACTSANTKCEIASCLPGYIDLDKSYATGCEYQCTPTNGGVEKCGDAIDNDCDGLIDSADDLSGDVKVGSLCFGDEPLRRGVCGLIANAGAYACVGNGYQCVGANVVVPGQFPETCDNQDNDCNGQVDDNPNDVGMACGVSNIYPCKKGTQQCVNGAPQCVGASNPSNELCDGIDNDCDGMIDDNPGDTGMPCGPMTDVGACQFGVTNCVAGVSTCQGAILPATESCNMIDDDCDGTVDDVNGVGTTCGQSNTMPCKFGTFQCVGANLACVGNIDPKAETCNMMDDNCNGQTDEGLPPQQCVPVGTDPTLVYGGSSRCRRGTQACGGACTGFIGPIAEVCDAIDNDCDGQVDDGLMLGACNVPIPPPAGATSPCKAGVSVCTSGVQTCQGSVGPSSSVDACGIDSNCDGALTGQPNFQTDVTNCGSCGNNCYNNTVFSVWGCTAGMCVFQGCQNGYYDLDGNNTCEYACSFLSAQEACNGQDDNCNGMVDEGVIKPTPVQVCGVSTTATSPECTTGVTVSCVAGAWQCAFPAGVCTGGCSANDETCDLLDNDCDGQLNENVANYGKPCASDDLNPNPGDGACRTTGTILCNGGSGTICSAVKANCATLPGGCTELCDGLDNDCDGLKDEVYTAKGTNAAFFVKPAVTRISPTRWIYSYEASRPTATTTSPGSGNGYQTLAPLGVTLDKTSACSAPSKLPWFNVTPAEVEQTCTAMGGSICAVNDWTSACQATIPCTWGYNPRGAACTSTYAAGKFCNLGPSYDFSSMLTGDQDGLLPTASSLLGNCWSDWTALQGNAVADAKVFDMTGNLREITKKTSPSVSYPLMGGAFGADPGGSTCTFSFYSTTDTTFQLYDLGYRCCFTTDPRL